MMVYISAVRSGAFQNHSGRGLYSKGGRAKSLRKSAPAAPGETPQTSAAIADRPNGHRMATMAASNFPAILRYSSPDGNMGAFPFLRPLQKSLPKRASQRQALKGVAANCRKNRYSRRNGNAPLQHSGVQGAAESRW